MSVSYDVKLSPDLGRIDKQVLASLESLFESGNGMFSLPSKDVFPRQHSAMHVAWYCTRGDGIHLCQPQRVTSRSSVMKTTAFYHGVYLYFFPLT